MDIIRFPNIIKTSCFKTGVCLYTAVAKMLCSDNIKRMENDQEVGCFNDTPLL
jgi:hypothetical protein